MSFKVRKAKFSDAKFWLNLRNRADVRRVSFSTVKIAWPRHKIWFREKLANKTSEFYVVSWNKKRIGQVRIDHDKPKSSIISIALLSSCRGKGFGPRAVKAASKDFIMKYPKKTLIANIKPENLQSARCFETAGFQYKGRAIVQKQPCKRYVIHK